MNDNRSSEELFQVVAGHNDGSPLWHIAQLELHRRALVDAGGATYRQTVVGAIAAIAAAVFALIALLK